MKRSYIGISIVIILAGFSFLVGALTLTDLPNEGGISSIKSTVNANNALIETDNATLLGYFSAQEDTNALVDATDFTPRFVGDKLIGTVSNWVFVAAGSTTSEWVDVSN